MANASGGTAALGRAPSLSVKKRPTHPRVGETLIHGVSLLLGLVTIGCVLLISVYLIVSGLPAIREIGLIEFLFGTQWSSTSADPRFGILPFILTSIYGTAGAMVIGVPVGFLNAVYAAKPAPARVKRLLAVEPGASDGRAYQRAGPYFHPAD